MAYRTSDEPRKDGGDASVDIRAQSVALDEDDRELEALGYVPSFKREFTNLATVIQLAIRSESDLI